MARHLKPEEARIFESPKDPDGIFSEAEALLRSLAEKENEPIELTFLPELRMKASPPDSLGS